MPFRRRRSAAACFLAATLAIAVIPASAQDRAFQFGLVGDTGYSKKEEAGFERVIAALEQRDVAGAIAAMEGHFRASTHRTFAA